MNAEAQISVAHDELDVFGHGGPALEAPAAIVDRDACITSRPCGRAHGLHRGLFRGGGTRQPD